MCLVYNEQEQILVTVIKASIYWTIDTGVWSSQSNNKLTLHGHVDQYDTEQNAITDDNMGSVC